jgi:hypothetical protein
MRRKEMNGGKETLKGGICTTQTVSRISICQSTVINYSDRRNRRGGKRDEQWKKNLKTYISIISVKSAINSFVRRGEGRGRPLKLKEIPYYLDIYILVHSCGQFSRSSKQKEEKRDAVGKKLWKGVCIFFDWYFRPGKIHDGTKTLIQISITQLKRDIQWERTSEEVVNNPNFHISTNSSDQLFRSAQQKGEEMSKEMGNLNPEKKRDM